MWGGGWGWGGGAIPHNTYRSSTLVGLRHLDMAVQAAFRTGSIFEACDDLLQTGDSHSAEEKHGTRAVVRIVLASAPAWRLILSRRETQNQGCGADSSGVFSPIGVRQRLEDAVPGSGVCLGLSNVVFVCEASV